MTQKIAWITDSTAFIPEELLSHKDLYILPLQISFSGNTYRDGIDLSTEEIYEKIDSLKEVPKTSQPLLGDITELYNRLKEEYDCAIAVHLSAEISGTYQASITAASLVNFPVAVVDSKLISFPMSAMILKGMTLAEKSVDYQEIATLLREEYKNIDTYILVGQLEQLHKGGRLNKIQFLLGSLLQISPILQFRDGIVGIYARVRTQKKAIKNILEQLQIAHDSFGVNSMQILHGNTLEQALQIKQEIKTLFPNMDVLVGPLSSTIGVHGGQGSIAFTWKKEMTTS